jgi:hypothetical protein
MVWSAVTALSLWSWVSGAAPDAKAAARAELERVASRIEQLKAEQSAGARIRNELEQLLIRSQELAEEIERLDRAAAPATFRSDVPDPDELRERADAMRDDADRLERSLSVLDRLIEEARRGKELQTRLRVLVEESLLFDEPGSARLSRPAAPHSSAAYNGSTASSSSKDPTGSSADTARLPPGADLRGLSAPSAQPGESDRRLRRKREALTETIAGLRAQAAALDEEARRLDSVR